MDNRNLIALGMLLIVVVCGMFKGQLDGNAVEKIITFLSGGVVGVTMPRRGDPPRPSGPAIAALAVFVMLFFGCATTEPYTGPVGPPTITGTEWVWPDIDGHLRRETTIHVNNARNEPLDGVLDCDPGHSPRAWRHLGTRMTIHVPPRTTQHVLLDRHDHVCTLLPSDANP